MNPVGLQRQQLAEVQFVLRSAALFLEHLDLRLQRLLPELVALAARWHSRLQADEDVQVHLLTLKQELALLQGEITGHETQSQQFQQARQQAQLETAELQQEIRFLQRELRALERILAGQESLQQTQYMQTALDLRQLYQHLEDQLEQTLQRCEGMEVQIHLLQASFGQLQQVHQQLHQENTHLQQALTGLEESEQEYLQLLEAKELQVQHLKALYEAELEQLAQTLEYSTQDHQQRQLQDQHLGRSLARLAQERNALQQQQQQQSDHLAQLETENQGLQAELASLREQLALLQSEDLDSKAPLARRLQIVSYLSFYETLQALGMEQTESLREAVAAHLQLAGQRGLLEQRAQLQPGALTLALQAQGLAQQQKLPLRNMAYVSIPAGAYPIGDDLQPAERPAHVWQSPGYEMALLPVTNADFAAFMADGGYADPDYWLPEAWALLCTAQWQAPAFWQQRGHHCGPDYPDYPVVGVSWYEAMAYAAWAGSTLPSEVEWEAAGRGPEGLRWPWGDVWVADCANTADAEIMQTTPVGLYPAGASAVGCLDLVGNVFEWTRSLFAAYPYRADDGREDLSAPGPRTLRGCSWNHRGSYFTRLSYRFQASPQTRHSDIGFRCARQSPV